MIWINWYELSKYVQFFLSTKQEDLRKNWSRLDDCLRNKCCLGFYRAIPPLKSLLKHLPSLCEGIISANLVCPLLFSSPKLNPCYCYTMLCLLKVSGYFLEDVTSVGTIQPFQKQRLPFSVRFVIFIPLSHQQDVSLRMDNLLQV